ncbi:phage holin family protein, partial [Chengkuizengella marina]|uniref:phage holin family protein n=1 Tax=Chengkuizengella marina TaxID=2507566 RepID=UPI001F205718
IVKNGGVGVEITYKSCIAVLGAIFSYLYSGLDTLIEILVAFVIIDYISGFIAAWVEGKLRSSVGYIGIAKKIMIFLIVAVAHLTDQIIGEGHLLRDATIFLYLANELLSIIENAGRIGLPVPSILLNAVEIFKNKNERR